MNAVASSREQVLGRIRAALRGRQNSAATAGQAAEAYAGLARDYTMRGELTVRACQERFVERLREYDAEVTECAPEELGSTIAALLAASGRRIFVAPHGLPAEWLAAGFEWKIDQDLPAEEIEKADGVVTACFCGVADSGTIVLHHSAKEGRRVITLLPDWHLCIVRASEVVETLPEYFDRCQVSGIRGQKIGNEGTREQGNEQTGRPPGLVTWISGPSATADIEMTRIKGVHGPRFLNVVLVKDGEQGPGNRE
ncbi:MAG: lactate utilization protein C [Terracidiphilus sp.]|jgi:L-lactate dehydrogenase complex protein LldG